MDFLFKISLFPKWHIKKAFLAHLKQFLNSYRMIKNGILHLQFRIQDSLQTLRHQDSIRV